VSNQAWASAWVLKSEQFLVSPGLGGAAAGVVAVVVGAAVVVVVGAVVVVVVGCVVVVAAGVVVVVACVVVTEVVVDGVWLVVAASVVVEATCVVSGVEAAVVAALVTLGPVCPGEHADSASTEASRRDRRTLWLFIESASALRGTCQLPHYGTRPVQERGMFREPGWSGRPT
jgi:hypothetical protein